MRRFKILFVFLLSGFTVIASADVTVRLGAAAGAGCTYATAQVGDGAVYWSSTFPEPTPLVQPEYKPGMTVKLCPGATSGGPCEYACKPSYAPTPVYFLCTGLENHSVITVGLSDGKYIKPKVTKGAVRVKAKSVAQLRSAAKKKK